MLKAVLVSVGMCVIYMHVMKKALTHKERCHDFLADTPTAMELACNMNGVPILSQCGRECEWVLTDILYMEEATQSKHSMLLRC